MASTGQYLLIVGADGELVAGESDGSKGLYLKSIDIKSWDWSVADQSSPAQGGKKGVKKSSKQAGHSAASSGDEKGVNPELFKFTKSVDTSTTRLMRAMDRNECMQWAKFILHEERGEGANDKHVDFLLEVTLDDVYVVGYSAQGRASEARVDIDENWELHYDKIKIDYVSRGGMNVKFKRVVDPDRQDDDAEETAAKSKVDKRLANLEKHMRKGPGRGPSHGH